MTTLKIGDLVELKSGGPDMTVLRVDTEYHVVDCLWWCESSEEFKEYRFPADTLDLIAAADPA
jgi:uncharacterized protein YodC (DUF2158 family)